VTFKVSLDSSILISHLVGDAHKDAVLLAIEQLSRRKAELFFSLVGYAEVWTGIELMDDGERKAQAATTFADIIQVNRLMIVADNVVIAKEAARVQAEYRRRGGRREVLIPDFLIGANAAYFSGRLLTTNPRDFLRSFLNLEVLTPRGFLEKYSA
jgi:predicted nucleic acid-binding protein